MARSCINKLFDIQSEMFQFKSHLKEGFPVIIVELEGSRVLSSQIADIFPALTEIKRTFKCQFQRRGVGRVLLVVMSI